MLSKTEQEKMNMIQEYSNTVDFNRLSSVKSYVDDFHMHNFYELFILLKGELSFLIQNSRYEITAGTLLVVNDTELHRSINRQKQPYERIYIHIPPVFFSRHATSEIDLRACFKNRKPGEHNLMLLDEAQTDFIIRQYESMKQAASYPLNGQQLLIDSYVIQLLIYVNNLFDKHQVILPSAYSANTQAIIHYIENHLLDALTLDKLADELFLNKYYMCHMFKKETGTTIFNYIFLCRISKAKTLLLQGKSVTEACYEAGFRDYTNFITAFKKVTGYTPKKYQLLMRRN